MITDDLELYKILKDFDPKISVFRDLADGQTISPYIVYRSLNCNKIYASGKAIGSLTEYEILLIQKNKNNIELKRQFSNYLSLSSILINNESESSSIEEIDEYYYLHLFTSILTM
ncbi:hypothetical protein AZF37_09760 (plasmid) [endosymbiont 'TC1' of Trimyema compressum]|uniref:hypothetical protein n=1 Tax=endosymbiont 'TC1' of Trimyema compressum TaxID=243899 RepID=UPI0007F1457D|nr:hypothetical protein [endosymbiont 'TC1' of Trimyema compressum]AMP21459.1 hypothetical protein AZF37_09760 [endosymbiont 'TC1' of Trimyema compressum]